MSETWLKLNINQYSGQSYMNQVGPFGENGWW